MTNDLTNFDAVNMLDWAEDEADPGLLERNLLAFADAVSAEFAKKLAGVSSDLRVDPIEDNIFVGEASLYPTTAAIVAVEQVSAYLKAPTRLSLSPAPPAPGYWRVNDTFSQRLAAQFGDKLQSSARAKDLISGYLISFGIGAGKHIPRLVHGLEVQRLVLIDQSLAFLRASLECIDWASVITTLLERGGSIDVVIAEDPVEASHRLYETVRRRGTAFLDGSYLFGHYNSAFFDAVQRAAAEVIPVMADSDGFLEDELLMLKNAAANLKNGARILKANAAMDLSAPPAIIVGSGPSVDGELDRIASLRDGAILISGGTGLGVLLEAGIKPDIHCEIENVPDIFTVNKAAADAYDLSGVHLVAASTVDPRLPEFYDETSFIIRENIAPTRLIETLLGTSDMVMEMAGPTVTHLACRTALALGVRDIYLFGVDLGAVEPDRHHSKKSIYSKSDDPYWQSGAHMEPLSVPTLGNFRDTVFTSREFAFARLYFTALARMDGTRRFFNCSDGVRIDAADPLPSKEISLPKMGADRRAILEGKSAALAAIDIAILSGALLEQTRGELERRINLLADLDLSAAQDPMVSMSKAALPDDGKDASFMVDGTASMLVQIANSMAGRASEADRPALYDLVRKEMIAAFDTLCKQVEE